MTATRSLDVHGIPSLLGGNADHTPPFLIREWIPGVSLSEWAAGLGADPASLLRVLHSLTLTVAGAHSRGLLHLDIKPANVIVDSRGSTPTAFLVDLESFAFLGDHESPMAAGVTPGYSAPELAGLDQFVPNVTMDIFSLGRTFEEARRLSCGSVRSPILRDLDAIISRCCEQDASRRYQTSLGLAEDLDAAIRRRPIKPLSHSLTHRLFRTLEHRPAVSITVAVLVVVGVATIVGGAVVTSRIARANRIAQNERADADRVAGLFADVLLASVDGPTPESPAVVRQLRRAAEILQESDETSSSRDAEAWLVVARALMKRGMASEALEQLRSMEDRGLDALLSDESKMRLQVALAALRIEAGEILADEDLPSLFERLGQLPSSELARSLRSDLIYAASSSALRRADTEELAQWLARQDRPREPFGSARESARWIQLDAALRSLREGPQQAISVLAPYTSRDRRDQLSLLLLVDLITYEAQVGTVGIDQLAQDAATLQAAFGYTSAEFWFVERELVFRLIEADRSAEAAARSDDLLQSMTAESASEVTRILAAECAAWSRLAESRYADTIEVIESSRTLIASTIMPTDSRMNLLLFEINALASTDPDAAVSVAGRHRDLVRSDRALRSFLAYFDDSVGSIFAASQSDAARDAWATIIGG